MLQKELGLNTCEQHGEQEMFFCEEDQRPLCDSCLSAPEHKDQQVVSLETAADKCKKKLSKIWRILQKKEEKLGTALDTLRRREAQLTEQTYTLRESAISEYRKIHPFLGDEEYQCLERLEQQSRDYVVKLEEKEHDLTKQIQDLRQMVFQVEENLDMMPLEMIQAVPDTLKKKEEFVIQRPLLPSISCPTCPVTGMREMLRSFFRDITFDPESAHPHLILSEDLKRVQYGSICQDLPDNKERFDCVLGVLGAQKFISGKHYWEMEMGDKTEWGLGICKDSISRKGKDSFSSKDVVTIAAFTSGNSFFFFTSEENFLLGQPVYKVGIFLDFIMQQIAFYDVTYRALIYNKSNMDLEGPLRPYFSPCLLNEKSTPGSLIICPKSPQ